MEIKSTIERRSIEDFKKFCDQLHNSTGVNFSESKEEQEKRKAKALRDYRYFVNTYFHIYADAECADFHVQAANHILNKPNLISILEWPREHAKSVHADIIIPMWLLIHGELSGMILMGKNGDDAANLLSDIQAQLQANQLFVHDWGEQFSHGDWATGDFTTRGGIRFLAIGRDQSPRGARKGAKRPNYAVIDDVDDDEMVNNQKRVKKVVNRILGGLFFALFMKRWRMVVAGNRIHAQSVLAHMVGDIKPNAPKRKNIYHSKVVALDPKTGIPAWHQRYTVKDIQDKLDAAGPTLGRKELFHENHVDGEIFKDNLILWKKMPKVNWKNYQVIVGYFDPSYEDNATSDFKAVRIWARWGKEKHCLKSFVRRTDTIDVFKWMSQYEDEELPPGVAVVWIMEKQFFNKQIREALKAHNTNRITLKKPTLSIRVDDRQKPNKYTRMVRMEPEYYNGTIYYNIDEIHNPDMIEGNNQLKGIEPGYRSPDDSPDADEGAWNELDKHDPAVQGNARIGGQRSRMDADEIHYSRKNTNKSW